MMPDAHLLPAWGALPPSVRAGGAPGPPGWDVCAPARCHAAADGVLSGESARIHSRYERRLADAAVSGQAVLVHLRVRRFFCDDPGCAKHTFAKQVPGLTGPHAQRTNLLGRLLTPVGLALGGRAGAWLARHLAAVFSRMTLLRLVRAAPEPCRYYAPAFWAWMTSSCPKGISTGLCWSMSRPVGRSRCLPNAPRQG